MATKEDSKPEKITADLILDLYLCAKKMPSIKQKKMMDQCKFLSQNLGKYIAFR